MSRFVVCGETLIDLVRAAGEEGTRSSTWHALSAGGPMNTAVALGKLGADSHFLGRLSSDEFGRQLRGHIEEAGVKLDLATTTDQFTSLAVVSLDEAGKASYAFHFSGTANFDWQPDELPELAEDDWLHIASLATVVSPGAEVLLEWAGRTRAALSIDINVRPTVIPDPKEYWRRVEPWLRVAGRNSGTVKASDEDIEFLIKAGLGQDWRVVTAEWVRDYGLGMALVTRGEGGASAILPGGEWVEVNGYPTDVVDTVGAGDTFMAGFVDAYVRDPSNVKNAMARGAAAASIVCSREGAQPPTSAEVDDLIASRGTEEVTTINEF